MIHFGKDVRNTMQTVAQGDYESPTVRQDAAWHQDATADTGDSHSIPGRGFLVLCAWCEDAFFARTKGEAMALFRDHESAMLGLQPVENCPVNACALPSHHGGEHEIWTTP